MKAFLEGNGRTYLKEHDKCSYLAETHLPVLHTLLKNVILFHKQKILFVLETRPLKLGNHDRRFIIELALLLKHDEILCMKGK